MLRSTPGKLFAADQRGRLETPQFRRYCTLSFGAYADEHKGPVGRLHGFNEETLAGGHHLELVAHEASYVLIIPITGEVQTSTAPDQATLVHIEQVQLVVLPTAGRLTLTNPYEDELVNFLHIWLTAEPVPAPPRLLPFDLQALENRLVDITAPAEGAAPLPFSLHLGRFAGRHEASFSVREGRQLFAFVIAGAFELEGRLLHEKDALALWGTPEVALEAHSQHALLVVLEV